MRTLMILATALALSGCAATAEQQAHAAWCAKFENVFPDIKTANACPPPSTGTGGSSEPTVNVFIYNRRD